MATKLYVGNLDYGVTSEQLGELFSQAGKVVEVNVISDRFSGRSKGFAFVEIISPCTTQFTRKNLKAFQEAKDEQNVGELIDIEREGFVEKIQNNMKENKPIG